MKFKKFRRESGYSMPDTSRSCEGKRKFGSLAAAERKVKELNSPFTIAYKCRCCNRWHVGHEPMSKSREYPGWN